MLHSRARHAPTSAWGAACAPSASATAPKVTGGWTVASRCRVHGSWPQKRDGLAYTSTKYAPYTPLACHHAPPRSYYYTTTHPRVRATRVTPPWYYAPLYAPHYTPQVPSALRRSCGTWCLPEDLGDRHAPMPTRTRTPPPPPPPPPRLLLLLLTSGYCLRTSVTGG